MISGGGSSLLQITEEDKFCARLLSKETSLANSSFRVYYGVAAAGSVPFRWESRPGTPKHTPAPAVLPPLTPPPSYYFSSPRSRTCSSAKKPAGAKSSFLSLSRLLALKKATVAAPSMSPSSSLSQSSSSLSSSSSYSPRSDHHGRPSDDDEAEFSGGGSLASTLCFGM
ncbi:uncharacterized protein LOC141836852 [Curcuma longa]|uniref:uncharacterized protein LOC141836852 n=1 Tax=Curcuma longa TaxID=136217 RepID=UPI003D9E09B4